MQKLLFAFSIVLFTTGAGTLASPTSSALGDRLDRAEARISSDVHHKRLSSEQVDLFRADVVAIRSASASDARRAGRLLDVLDRQLARNDLELAMPEDNNDILVHVGDTIVVAMHDERNWSVRSSDSFVLAPKIGVMYLKGVQGSFSAKRPGAAELTLASRAARLPGSAQPVTRFVRFRVIVIAAASQHEGGRVL